MLAAICCHLAWKPLLHKRLSVLTLINMPWHLRIFSAVVGASVPPERQTEDAFGGVPMTQLVNDWSFTETTFLALLTRRPGEDELFAFSILLGLTATNGPGTISAQGAKGAVSADGPEAPERVQINKAYVGFLTHTGYAHGGNGFEAMRFLIGRFGGLTSPTRAIRGTAWTWRGSPPTTPRSTSATRPMPRPRAICPTRRSPASTIRCSRAKT